jgi:hypothetical protein
VLDHYGCHSKPHLDWYWVQDTWGFTGENQRIAIMRKHEDTSSRECQYRKETPTDPRCEGCSCP